MAEQALTTNRPSSGRLRAALERVSWILSIYGVPILIGAVSIAALLTWDDQYAVVGGKPLPVQVLADGGALTPRDARLLIDKQPALAHFETRRSEAPIWFAFALPAQIGRAHV